MSIAGGSADPSVWKTALRTGKLPHASLFILRCVLAAPEALMDSFMERPEAVDGEMLCTLAGLGVEHRLLDSACSASSSHIDRADWNRNTPAHFAASIGDITALEVLKCHGADMTCRNLARATPLAVLDRPELFRPAVPGFVGARRLAA